MKGPTIHPERIRWLNAEKVASGKYVLYWMQQSQRAADNHALEYAIQRANARRDRPHHGDAGGFPLEPGCDHERIRSSTEARP